MTTIRNLIRRIRELNSLKEELTLTSLGRIGVNVADLIFLFNPLMSGGNWLQVCLSMCDLFKGLCLSIKRLSFNSNANFLFSLISTLKKMMNDYKMTIDC